MVPGTMIPAGPGSKLPGAGGPRLLSNSGRSFKQPEASLAGPESSLHVFVRAYFAAGSVPGNSSGYTSGCWRKLRAKAERSEKAVTFEVTLQLWLVPAGCAGGSGLAPEVHAGAAPGPRHRTWAQRASQAAWVGTSLASSAFRPPGCAPSALCWDCCSWGCWEPSRRIEFRGTSMLETLATITKLPVGAVTAAPWVSGGTGDKGGFLSSSYKIPGGIGEWQDGSPHCPVGYRFLKKPFVVLMFFSPECVFIPRAP
ncbi:uncharacterized protein LOC128314169 [Acinonyx jubatus]|uniref:Uncharacterized protein LOC128314169 n=1 Tax=Acinonyx jubatus TaxID=32536 RepID=A0ABM3PK83_ACIJB|nr:uncharacterized protein LOC128314169 [Acinonyx jubatus]